MLCLPQEGKISVQGISVDHQPTYTEYRKDTMYNMYPSAHVHFHRHYLLRSIFLLKILKSNMQIRLIFSEHVHPSLRVNPLHFGLLFCLPVV